MSIGPPAERRVRSGRRDSGTRLVTYPCGKESGFSEVVGVGVYVYDSSITLYDIPLTYVGLIKLPFY